MRDLHTARSRASHVPTRSIGQPRLRIRNVKKKPRTTTVPGTAHINATPPAVSKCPCRYTALGGGLSRSTNIGGSTLRNCRTGKQPDHRHQLRGMHEKKPNVNTCRCTIESPWKATFALCSKRYTSRAEGQSKQLRSARSHRARKPAPPDAHLPLANAKTHEKRHVAGFGKP